MPRSVGGSSTGIKLNETIAAAVTLVVVRVYCVVEGVTIKQSKGNGRRMNWDLLDEAGIGMEYSCNETTHRRTM